MSIQQEIKDRIRDLLEASEPCTLEMMLEEVRVNCGIRRQTLLPQVITAIAAMIEDGTICEYDQSPIDDPLEYAWLLSQEPEVSSTTAPALLEARPLAFDTEEDVSAFLLDNADVYRSAKVVQVEGGYQISVSDPY